VTFLYVEDLARAVVLAASDERSSGSTMFLGHPAPTSAGELLETIAEAVGRACRPIRVPRPALRAAATIGDVLWRAGATPLVDSARFQELSSAGFVCSVVRAQTVLGFRARIPLREGIQRTADWYRQRGWL
jgi:nucleoside-diphosphate-sugar epimerase